MCSWGSQEYAEAEDGAESDDDFDGAVETHVEDPDMAEEADFKAQEDAEELKRQRIEGTSSLPSSSSRSQLTFVRAQSSD